ncbi:MAG: GIY-YIG nuclease family protein [Alphaproteobacteria bacterium]|nr:GIY-YIG nuclease family protein [Alphaproteobacteria bacterium]
MPALNGWVEAFPERLLVEKYIELARDLGHLPTQSELQLRANADETFPGVTPFRRIGRQALIQKVRDLCSGASGYEDVLGLCEEDRPPRATPKIPVRGEAQSDDGFVYLIRSGRFYKIGRSVAVGQRERQLKIQLPEKTATVHDIRTDDPVGIEAYWHRRFSNKRKNGEWFDLDAQDVSAFKRRKFM